MILSSDGSLKTTRRRSNSGPQKSYFAVGTRWSFTGIQYTILGIFLIIKKYTIDTMIINNIIKILGK